jgi:hypothetical protein
MEIIPEVPAAPTKLLTVDPSFPELQQVESFLPFFSCAQAGNFTMLESSPLPPHSKIIGAVMSSPIGFREFSEDDYRKFIRTLSDEELIKAGNRLRILCGHVVTPTPSTFDKQLKICREEYRRRHPMRQN